MKIIVGVKKNIVHTTCGPRPNSVPRDDWPTLSFLSSSPFGQQKKKKKKSKKQIIIFFQHKITGEI